jgi:hypothetical protein
MIAIVGIFVALMTAALWYESRGEQPSTEQDEARQELADAAVVYCEMRRLNRMESFQRAAWSRYCEAAEHVETIERGES